MCGIVGYIGKRKAYPILMEGLHKLEYRGYDSAGTALISESGSLNLYKAKGKVADLESVADGVGSSIARISDTGVYIHVGPEIGVASTKAFTGQVTVLTLLALALGHELGTLNNADYYQIIEELSEIP